MNLLSLWFSLILFSLNSWGASEVYRPPTDNVGKGSYEVEVLSSFFEQIALFDNDGNEVAQDGISSFYRLDNDLTLRYGFSKAFELSAFSRFRSQQGKNIRTESNVDETFQVSGAESFGVGVKYLLPRARRWNFAAEFNYRQTLYDNVDFDPGSSIPNNEEVVLGDSGSEISLIGHISFKRTRNHFLEASLAYRAPGNSLSPEVPYNLASVWPYTRFAFRLGVRGITSLGGDTFTDNPTDKPLQAVGSTNLYNSINREFVTPYGGVSYAFDSFRVDLTGGQTIAGVSTDKGIEVRLGIVWRSRKKSAAEATINTFKEYVTEASVIKVSPRGKFIKIDQGISGDVEKGMRFDIYQTDYFGGNVLVGSGSIFEVGADWSIIKLTKKYKKIPIKKGFTARGK